MIGHGCGHGNGRGLRLKCAESLLQLGSGADRMAAQALQPGGIHGQGPMDQIHRGAAQPGGLGQQHAHAPRAGVGEAAGRIEPFAGGASGDEQVLAGPIAAPAPKGEGLQGQEQGGGFGHAAGPLAVAGQQAGSGAEG